MDELVISVVAGLSIGALIVYAASALITLATRRSLLVSLAIAVLMSLGFVTFVTGASMLIVTTP